AHSLLGDEGVGAISAELPAVEVIGVAGDELCELRLPVGGIGCEKLRPGGIGGGCFRGRAGEGLGGLCELASCIDALGNGGREIDEAGGGGDAEFLQADEE